MPTANPDLEVSSRVWKDRKGRRWWDVQVIFDLEDLGVSRSFQSGDHLRLSLARIFQFPWHYSSVPTSSSYMDSAGFSVAKLVDEQPHVRMADCAGFKTDRCRFRAHIYNPSKTACAIRVLSRVADDNGGGGGNDSARGSLVVPPDGERTITIERELPQRSGWLELRVRSKRNNGSDAIFDYSLPFGKNTRSPAFLDFTPVRPAFPLDYVRFDGETERMVLQADALLTDVREGVSVHALVCVVRARNKRRAPVATVRSTESHDSAFEVELDLSGLAPGEYSITGALLDGQGAVLLERTLRGFEKIEDRHGTRYIWWRKVETDAEGQAGQQPLRDLRPIAARVNGWYRQGTAAGNIGDYYHNHDHLHSYLRLGKFPHVTPIDATDAARSLVGAGLQHRKLFTRRVIGNASMVADGVSLPEYAYRRPRHVHALHRQYRNNHLYLYPSHRTGPSDYSAYTPYVIASRGSSGSEQKIMEALFATLASFRLETKELLTARGLIAPTLQMLLRRHYDDVKTPEDYLSAESHPLIFDGKKVGIEGMVEAAQRMMPEDVPPLVRLRVLNEDAKRKEQFFTTPAAIARILGEEDDPYAMELSAAGSFDVHGRDVRLEWCLLRGDARSTKVELVDGTGDKVKLTFTDTSRRIDIGVFAHNGVHWSAPAIISCRWRRSGANR
jgi:hypothetical protein